MKEVPCRKCKKRNSICHSNCELYLNWKRENDAEKKKIKRRKDFDRNYEDSLFVKRPRRR